MSLSNSCYTFFVAVIVVASVQGLVSAGGQQSDDAQLDEKKNDMPSAGKQVKLKLQVVSKEDQTVDVGCLVFLPTDYDKKTKFPLMIFLHGAGERGDDLDLVKVWGPPKRVDADENYRNSFPFVLVSPQCPRKTWWDVHVTAQVLDLAIDKFHIDKSRVYVTGLSMGGFGTWALAANQPGKIAAIIPICGGGDPKTAEQLKDMPAWAFHGDKDTAVRVEQSRKMVDAVKKLDGEAKLTIYEGVGHNSWERTYANPRIYKWLLEQQRR